MPNPNEVLKELETALGIRSKQIEKYEAYYSGNHSLAFATSKFREAFGNLFSAFADNWMEIVVQASIERLEVDGFRYGEGQSATDELAWQIWEANDLDTDSVAAHTESVKCGVAYLLVDPYIDKEYPKITVEHPLQVITKHAPGTKERVSGLKKWKDGEYYYANVYLPEAVYKYISEAPQTSAQNKMAWTLREEPIANPLNAVPLVPLENNRSLLYGGCSDLKTAIPLNDAINKLVTDMIVAAEFQAFRQRVLTGVEIPRDPETGEPYATDEMKSAMSRLWVFEGDNAKVTELGTVDLGNYVKGIETLTQHLAAVTRTPPHYLLGQVVNASGEALGAAEAGLVSKVKRKQKDFGKSWLEVMRLSFLSMEKTAEAEILGRVIWANPEKESVAQLADALVKFNQIGIPLTYLWAKAGYSPQEIEAMTREKGLPPRQ